MLVFAFVGKLIQITNKKREEVFFEFQINDENVYLLTKEQLLDDIKESINSCEIEEIIRIKRVNMSEEQFLEIPCYDE
jgi:hypothetical protein